MSNREAGKAAEEAAVTVDHPTETLAIVFADVSGSTRLFDDLGDAEAAGIMARALAVMSAAVVERGGTVRRTIGDEVFCTFDDAETGLFGVLEIANAVHEDAELASRGLSIRIGMHLGDVLFGEQELFGDAINVAARMASLARSDQIVTTRSTADRFPPDCRRFLRRLPSASVRGKSAPIEVVEILWQAEGGALTTVVDRTRDMSGTPPKLLLLYDDDEFEIGPDSVPFVLGRGDDCDLTVDFRQVSRWHASIELHGRTFVLKDHSTNGTFVRIGAGETIPLHRNHLPLQRWGVIALGRGADAASHLVHFNCDG